MFMMKLLNELFEPEPPKPIHRMIKFNLESRDDLADAFEEIEPGPRYVMDSNQRVHDFNIPRVVKFNEEVERFFIDRQVKKKAIYSMFTRYTAKGMDFRQTLFFACDEDMIEFKLRFL